MTFLAGEVVTAAKLNSEHPLGRIGTATSTGAVTLNDTNPHDTDASVVVNNTDTVTRRYMARSRMRFNMATGTNGIYRPAVSNGSGLNLGSTIVQLYTNVTGGPGQIGGAQEYHFTLTAGTSQTVAAAGWRVSGGGTTDTALAAAVIDVYDLGPA